MGSLPHSFFGSTLFYLLTKSSRMQLDLFDPHRHFSTYATRLAVSSLFLYYFGWLVNVEKLRNQGLMKAILALAARHSALAPTTNPGQPVTDLNEAVQYYYETLHYVQTALKKYDSYALSEELLGTAIVISTYEMLDSSDSNWQRHLKGVFWIQRSQDVNGDRGGLGQSVWWAWLRQDVWAAFRERRRCFSFWRPVKGFSQLTQDELACRSVYLLSQAVNYCAIPDGSSGDHAATSWRSEQGQILLEILENWKSSCGPKFQPLPTPTTPSSVFQPIWVHPPHFAVALQVVSFARILITLHTPANNGFDGYLKIQVHFE